LLRRVTAFPSFVIIAFLGVWAACAARSQLTPTWSFLVEPLASASNASMRGLSVVDAQVAWASGTGGSVLRTIDGGLTWHARPVRDADSLDLRDIEAFDSLTAYVLSAGQAGRIYRTDDGGLSWQLEFTNDVPGAFFDCFDFFDRDHGMAMSDPVDGHFLLLARDDSARWLTLPQSERPVADSAEAAFAASGTCLTIAGERTYLATGGGEHARVFWSADRGKSWNATLTPVPASTGSAGIFALAFRDSLNGIAIGGDYQRPLEEARLAMTADGGRSWHVAGKTSYASGAAWSPSGESLLAVGTSGTRLSRDRGLTWTRLDSLEYNAVQFADEQVAYAVGPRGRIAKLLRR
jgi:photosystem II stability/assembly factor-like uncharacterized protein